MNRNVKKIVTAGLIAAMYVVLTLLQNALLPGTTSAAVQYRASDFGAHQIIELRTHIGFNAGVGVARRVAGILGDILQIEGDARSSGLICHGVESITAVQQVRAGVAAQHIVADTAIEGVVSFSANQGIVADTTIKEVVTTFAEQAIIASLAVKTIMGVVAASLELVVAIPAIDRIASEAAGYRVLTGTAVDPVIIGAAINYIIAVSSINAVIASLAPDRVVSAGTIDGIPTIAAINQIVVIRIHDNISS